MKREDIIATLKQNEAGLRARGVAHAALFGSRARGDNSPNSDIDIMIEIAPDAPVDLFEYVAITQYLADLFPIRVDVGTGASSNRSFGQAPRNLRSMRSNKTALALFDIRDNGRYAQDFVAGLSLDDFKTDRMRFYAVTRAIEIVSEAARRLPSELQARHPELPWRAIMGSAMS